MMQCEQEGNVQVKSRLYTLASYQSPTTCLSFRLTHTSSSQDTPTVPVPDDKVEGEGLAIRLWPTASQNEPWVTMTIFWEIRPHAHRLKPSISLLSLPSTHVQTDSTLCHLLKCQGPRAYRNCKLANL